VRAEDSTMHLVIFGVSNMLGDVLDCGLALGIRRFTVVRNMPEVLRERTRSAESRIAQAGRLAEISLVEFGDFRPSPGQRYTLGTTASARKDLLADTEQRYGIAFEPLVHPSAYVSPLARLGRATFVGARAVIGPFVTLGRGVFVNRAVSIGHDTQVGEFARLQPGSNIGGHVTIGPCVTVGIGAAIVEELQIGENAVITAGAVVIEDVPANCLMAGPRARRSHAV
jgi:sugar O-acyltransferase (sialic acid O-acetyltransferase NeuD family)